MESEAHMSISMTWEVNRLKKNVYYITCYSRFGQQTLQSKNNNSTFEIKIS